MRYDILGATVPNRIARAFDRKIDANVYAVLHLKREADGVRGCRSVYDREAIAFLKRLTIRVKGKRDYLRKPPGKRFLNNAISIEKLDECPHFNVMIQRPDGVAFETFEMMMRDEWLKSGWASTDTSAIQIEARQMGSDLFGYCHKEGDEALVHETLSF